MVIYLHFLNKDIVALRAFETYLVRVPARLLTFSNQLHILCFLRLLYWKKKKNSKTLTVNLYYFPRIFTLQDDSVGSLLLNSCLSF